MMPTPRALANLERIKDHYGGASTAHKLALLRALDRARHAFSDRVIEYAAGNATVAQSDLLIGREVDVMVEVLT